MTMIMQPAERSHIVEYRVRDTFVQNTESMNIATHTKDNLLTGAPLTMQPSAALVFAFDPKMTPKADLEASIKRMLGTVEKELLSRHPADGVMPVIKRLQQALRGLNFSTHKRSAAVWVSASVSSVTYMDFAVEERVLVDQPFRVRDLADCKPSGKEYLLLLLSGKESKMYRKTGTGLRLIKTNGPQTVYACLNEVPEKAGNFSDRNDRQEVMLNKFLHHMDEGLGQVLKAYPLPVIVAGAEWVAGHFSRITRNARNIAGYVQKHCIDNSTQELESMLQPMLNNWDQLRQQLLFLQLEKAWEAGKLVCGVEEVRKAARCRNSRLIVIERSSASAEAFFTESPLDSIVEKVLANGGDVEKMDPQLFGRFGPVALIRYY
jgi:hypothetical protein